MNLTRKILFYMGMFLLIDGILSVYFGNSCLNSCFNNSDIGNLVRYVRAIIGGILVYANR